MKVENIGAKAAHARSAQADKQEPAQEKAERSSTPSAGQAKDRVELSLVGRALAGGMEAAEGLGELTSHEIDALRAKIAGGDYSDPEVIEVIAERILDSGDL